MTLEQSEENGQQRSLITNIEFDGKLDSLQSFEHLGSEIQFQCAAFTIHGERVN
jgi:hypothetical protein